MQLGTSDIISLLTGVVLPLVLPDKSKAATTVALIGDAYAVYADVEGHRGLQAVSADTAKLLRDLDAEVGPSVFSSLIGEVVKIPATIADYEHGDLAVLSNRTGELGLSAGKIYAVKDGGDAADKIGKIFYDGTFELVPIATAETITLPPEPAP